MRSSDGLIVRGALAPGRELSQVELARRTGVSTTPLREALRRLEAEGLVESRRNRRPRVRPFDCQDLDSVYAARVLLEPLALRLTVPRLTAGDLSALRDRLDAMRRVAAQVEIAILGERPPRLPPPPDQRRAGAAARADRDSDGARRPLSPDRRSRRHARRGARWATPSTRRSSRPARRATRARAAWILRTQLVRSARTVQAIVVPGAELPALDGSARGRHGARGGRCAAAATSSEQPLATLIALQPGDHLRDHPLERLGVLDACRARRRAAHGCRAARPAGRSRSAGSAAPSSRPSPRAWLHHRRDVDERRSA